MARKLTKKQKEFADEYLKTGNGSESAKKTYKITTDGSARAVASENLTKPNIKAYSEKDDILIKIIKKYKLPIRLFIVNKDIHYEII